MELFSSQTFPFDLNVTMKITQKKKNVEAPKFDLARANSTEKY